MTHLVLTSPPCVLDHHRHKILATPILSRHCIYTTAINSTCTQPTNFAHFCSEVYLVCTTMSLQDNNQTHTACADMQWRSLWLVPITFEAQCRTLIKEINPYNTSCNRQKQLHLRAQLKQQTTRNLNLVPPQVITAITSKLVSNPKLNKISKVLAIRSFFNNS